MADFLIGLAVGTVLGTGATLLLAPQSGQKTRAQLRGRSSDIKQRAEQDVAKVQAHIEESATDLRQQIDDLRKRLAEMPDQGRDSVKEQADKVKKLAEETESKLKVTH